MSVRRILNHTSRKKQNSITQWVPNTNGSPAAAGTVSDIAMSANQGTNVHMFCPTFNPMDAGNNSGSISFAVSDSSRQAQTAYLRGYKETTTIRLTGGTPWRRRRIVFSAKGLPARLLSADTTFVSAYYSLIQNTLGVVRQTTPLGTTQVQAIQTFLFKGTANLDWFSPFNAKLDTQFFKIHSDRTLSFNPGNSTGQTKLVKQWIPMNHNMVYDDDENGDSSIPTSGFANQGRSGMGDVYIVDFYQSTLTTASDGLVVNNEGTLYWHEK